MSAISCGGADVLSGRVHLTLRKAWWAELALDTDTVPTGKVSISFDGGVSLSGTVMNGGSRLDSAHVRLVAGAGGLRTLLAPNGYQGGLLSDPLNYIMGQSGEALSSLVDPAILALSLATWTITAVSASAALDALASAASRGLGQTIGWRVLSNGAIWLGAETWPSQSLAKDADVLEVHPHEGRYVIGETTPTLLPGISLSDIGGGNIVAVDYWISAEGVTEWAWI